MNAEEKSQERVISAHYFRLNIPSPDSSRKVWTDVPLAMQIDMASSTDQENRRRTALRREAGPLVKGNLMLRVIA